MDSKKQNSKRTFLLLLTIVGIYLFFTAIAFFRSKGDVPVVLYAVALIALGAILVVWISLGSRSGSRLFHYAGLALLFLASAATAWALIQEWKWELGEPARREAFLKELQVYSAEAEWISEEGFALPVGLRFKVDIGLPPLKDFQSFSHFPLLTLTPDEHPSPKWGAQDWNFKKHGVFLKSILPKTPNPRTVVGRNSFQFDLYPSFLTEVEAGKFCVNTTQASVASAQPQFPTLPEGPYLTVEWLLGNHANLGWVLERALVDSLGEKAPGRLHEAMSQFERSAANGSFKACQSIPKESSICFCLLH